MVWETLIEHPNYEINTVFPHDIRNKQTSRVVSEHDVKPKKKNKEEEQQSEEEQTDSIEENEEEENKKYYKRLNLRNVNNKKYKKFYKHKLVAKQWLNNVDTEHKTQVDHINRDKSDYHIYNLRWTTPSENNSNKQGYKGDVYKFEYALTYNVIMIKRYNGHDINNLYKMDGEYYVFDDEKNIYQRVLKLVDKNNRPCIYVYDVNDEIVRIYLDDE